MVVYAIDGPEDLSSKNFSILYTATLEDILEDPEARIIITDKQGCGIFIARYLEKHYYRNAIIYHMGQEPRHNIAKLKTQGGFMSKAEITAQMINDSDHYIYYE